MQGYHLMQPPAVPPVVKEKSVVQLGNGVDGCLFPPNTSTKSQGIDVVPRTRTGLSGLGPGDLYSPSTNLEVLQSSFHVQLQAC